MSTLGLLSTEPSPWPLAIELPGEPKGKGRPRFTTINGMARAYTPKPTRDYEDALREVGALVMRGRDVLDEALCVGVLAAFSVPASWSRKKQDAALAGIVRPTGKPDADNLVKMLDALNGVVFRDDALIVEAHVQKVYAQAPLLRVLVTPIAAKPFAFGELTAA